jgi:DNA-binding Xre family transcriptional regulator
MSRDVLAGRAGISASTVARLEQGQRTSCRGRTLARLAAALEADPSTITPG